MDETTYYKIMERTEYQKAWDDRIQLIEVGISESLIKGVTPEILMGTDRTIRELCEHLEVVPDWNNPDGRAIAFGDDGEIPLVLFRTVDLPYGKIVIR